MERVPFVLSLSKHHLGKRGACSSFDRLRTNGYLSVNGRGDIGSSDHSPDLTRSP